MEQGASTCYRHPQQLTRIACQRCERPICPQCMVPGAVGFHCPDCLRQGVQQTRQAQLPYGGQRRADTRVSVVVLIALNVLVWLAVAVTTRTSTRLLDALALLPVGRCEVGPNGRFLIHYSDCVATGMQWVPGVATGAWWQPITSGFTHEAIYHLGFNMFVLWMLGPQIERIVGRSRFVALYLISLLGGAAAVMFGTGYVQTVGASGAIYGLLGAILLLAIKHRGDVRQILLWLGLNIVFTFVVPGISWEGHLGGLAAGLAATAALIYLPKRYRAAQWPILAGLTLLIVAVILVQALAVQA